MGCKPTVDSKGNGCGKTIVEQKAATNAAILFVG
jgi:hypothetical protein